VPEALKPIRDKLEHGSAPERRGARPGVRLRPRESDDPRPWLLIAHAYAQLNWVSDSVERYQRAYRADPTSRGDPQMLEDLLKAATHRTAGRNAVKAIRDMYGAEALPALEKAIARGAGDKDGTTASTTSAIRCSSDLGSPALTFPHFLLHVASTSAGRDVPLV
jgi:hypothetical protein